MVRRGGARKIVLLSEGQRLFWRLKNGSTLPGFRSHVREFWSIVFKEGEEMRKLGYLTLRIHPAFGGVAARPWLRH